MKNELNKLPSDNTSLQGIVADLIIKNKGLETKAKDLEAENRYLREQLKLMRARKFGQSSEKSDRQIELIELQIEESEQLGTIELEEDSATAVEKRQPKRQKLPEHLERIEVILNPEPLCPSCGGEKFRKISDDISETLEYVPASFKVKRYIRSRCACVNCETIVQAYAASKTIDKGKAGSSLLAHILVQKYCNHLPLYRQSQMYAREGIEISRSTMASWVGQCAKLLTPVIEGIKESVFASNQIHGDDTQRCPQLTGTIYPLSCGGFKSFF